MGPGGGGQGTEGTTRDSAGSLRGGGRNCGTGVLPITGRSGQHEERGWNNKEGEAFTVLAFFPSRKGEDLPAQAWNMRSAWKDVGHIPEVGRPPTLTG